ncbi:MAG: ATP-binding protein [Lunatimonas sp.]|uniref:AlbA family DNA-binding domain-containing protein n=1 Tax=Lunatimonas sp. TaxID=2060141 RepID=UPI00263BB89D|nr:ATP-binding protein [Lunatimonas sp.]MCC5938809.1 ATP-binding protein [Lunatimonas sp.]
MESPKKDNDFVKKIISQPEGINLDFKQSISNQQKIAKSIVAFANTFGGTIVVGVSDQGQITGIDPEEEKFMLGEAIANYCTPPITHRFETYEIAFWKDEKLEEEKYILLLHIPESQAKPHYVVDSEGTRTYYLRKEDRSVPVSKDAEGEF